MPVACRDTICARNEYTADEFTGYNIAVAEEIARRLGVEPCFVTPTRTEIISGSWADRWDIHIGSLAITPERMKVMYFTQPYYAGPVSLFVNKNNTAYSNPGDLSGKKIGVCAGCILERYLEGTLDLPGQKIDFAIKNATVVAYENEAVALSDLALGDGVKLDAVLTNQPLGEDSMKNGMPLRQLGRPVFYDYDAAAVDKKSGRDPASFVSNVTGIIREMNRDGTLLKVLTTILWAGSCFGNSPVQYQRPRADPRLGRDDEYPIVLAPESDNPVDLHVSHFLPHNRKSCWNYRLFPGHPVPYPFGL